MAAPAAPPAAIGERIVGDYILGRRLGSGATAEVWLGWHRRTEAPAAIKLMRERARLRGRTRRLLDREWRAVARLSHPNIVALYEVGPDYLAMAYVDGHTLAQRLHTPMAPAQAIHIALQLASALEHAHGRGVVHQDVKPGNVLLDAEENAYLGDFGLAIVAEEAHALRGGTPGYMAPEQARRGVVGPAADQYALARTVVDMLLGGNAPPARDEALALLGARPELTDVLARALEEASDQRFASVAHFARRLGAIDLGDEPPAQRLAPERRVRAPFGWCTAPLAVQRVSADIDCAHYALGALERAGHVDAGSAAEFRARTGYADFGWSMYAHTSRLGPVAHTSLLARASDLVVLVHGNLCTRQVWRDIAATICRRNAQTIVLAPDVLGFGASPFASELPAATMLSARALVSALLAWLELLSLRDLPTVLAGHSASAVALLSVTDEDLGELISRVAITPMFARHDGDMERAITSGAMMLRTLGRTRSLRRLLSWLACMYSRHSRQYRREERLEMHRQLMSVPWPVVAGIYEGVARAVPAPTDRLERCAIVVGKDDPVAPEERVLAILRPSRLPQPPHPPPGERRAPALCHRRGQSRLDDPERRSPRAHRRVDAVILPRRLAARHRGGEHLDGNRGSHQLNAGGGGITGANPAHAMITATLLRAAAARRSRRGRRATARR